jgi:hypothetical protein
MDRIDRIGFEALKASAPFKTGEAEEIIGGKDIMGGTAETVAGTLALAHMVASFVGGPLGAVHGYRRNNDSIGWGIGWFFFGGMMPEIALPLMYVEGFGKPASK